MCCSCQAHHHHAKIYAVGKMHNKGSLNQLEAPSIIERHFCLSINGREDNV